MTIHKILKYLAIVIGVIGLILLGRVIMTGDDAIEASADVQASVVTPFLYVAYLVFAIIVLLVLFYVIKGLFSGDIKRTLMAVGAFIVVIGIAYVLTDGTQRTLSDGTTLSASADHWVGAGLVTFYMLAGIAILLMVVSGIRKLIK